MSAAHTRFSDSEQKEEMPKGALTIVLSVTFVTAVGNTGMQSVLPAIGRETGIPDALVAGIFSLSALLWAIASPVWAKQSDLHGRKPLILLGLLGFAISMLGCAIVVAFGVRHLAAPMVIFAFFIAVRAIFGLFGSAAPPASQAYIAERTSRAKRTSAIASIAGAFGLGTMFGPVIAPGFSSLPVIGQAGPMVAFSLMAFGVFLWVWKCLPETWERPAPVVIDPKQEKKPPLWKDPRVAPFLIYGFFVSACQTAQYQTLGFLVIDQMGIAPLKAQGFTSLAMMTGAVAGVFAQWGLIRIFSMSPRNLLRWGAILAASANLITAVSVAMTHSYVIVVVGFALSSLGYGLARPGYSAGASLAVSGEEQARSAGAIAAVNGLNVVIAPFLVALYQVYNPGPYMLNVLVLGGLILYAFRNKALHTADGRPAEQDDTAAASLDRNSAGSGF